ncbi:hypothetical protein LCGC14_2735540 [marine sediment metagenome]|uniref:Uncharacterized protein n=1 Tax=marine sediment metagenome TaxID=412755 RepID=A0A0F8Z5Y0_9ZZZZ
MWTVRIGREPEQHLFDGCKEFKYGDIVLLVFEGHTIHGMVKAGCNEYYLVSFYADQYLDPPFVEMRLGKELQLCPLDDYRETPR